MACFLQEKNTTKIAKTNCFILKYFILNLVFRVQIYYQYSFSKIKYIYKWIL